MKIINAEWEKRNLGVRTIEIVFEKNGDEEESVFEEIDHIIKKNRIQYAVCKVPTNSNKSIIELQKRGFFYIENQISLKCKLKECKRIIEKYDFLVEDTEYKKIDSVKELDVVCSEIEKGIFETDRIALDPLFGIEIANKRYSNWVCDLYNSGKSIYITMYKGTPIGFIVFGDKNSKCLDGIVGGLYNNYKNSGLGHYWKICSAKIIMGSNKNAVTKVSSNNLDILKLHESFGYTVTNIESVFVKHF